MIKIVLASFLISFSISASAVNINHIDIGDVYYLSKLGDNIPVQVLRIDRSYSKVKIRKGSGFTEWVHSSDLLNESENPADELKEGAGWVLGTMVFLCALDEKCRSSN